MTYPNLWNDFSFARSSKRRRSAYGDLPQLNDLTSQYPILLSLAENLSTLDLINLGLTSRTTWNHLSAPKRPYLLRKGVVKTSLRCEGLHIQPRPQSPHQGTPYVLPCASSQFVPVKRCECCGVAVCEVCQCIFPFNDPEPRLTSPQTCRFNPTKGAMLTYTHKRRWFFPSRSSSRPDTVVSNIETMLDSMVRRGRIARRDINSNSNSSSSSNATLLTTEQLFTHLNHLSPTFCACTVETRWLDPWLCVPCLNQDIFRAPTHEAYYATRRRSSLALACQQGNDIGPLSNLLDCGAATAHRGIARRLRSMEQCNLCYKRLSRRDPAARSGRCLPPLEEGDRRRMLREKAMRLQGRRREGCVGSGRRGSWPKRRDTKGCGAAVPLPLKFRADVGRRRRVSELVVFDD
jgi:hypothetical protein